MLLKEILDNKLFNTPLLVKGYSNFKIFKDKKEFLLKVGLENKETKEIFATDNLQPEFLSSNSFVFLQNLKHKKITPISLKEAKEFLYNLIKKDLIQDEVLVAKIFL